MMNETTSVQINGLTAHLPTPQKPIWVSWANERFCFDKYAKQRSTNRPANDNKENKQKQKYGWFIVRYALHK